jgi:hypothetical protein
MRSESNNIMHYRRRLIITSLVVILLLSSCANSINNASYKFSFSVTKGSDYTYYAYGGRNSINYETLFTENVSYYFESKNYSEEQKNEFINKVETLRTFFENELNISFYEPLSVYISKKNIFRGNKKKVYLNDLNLCKDDVTTVFLQSLLDETINFGLCYGIACYANEKLYNKSILLDISIDELKNYYSSSGNIELMDLTIPVFQTIFFNEEQNQYAYATSYYFVKDLIERKGIDYCINLLKKSSRLDLDFDANFSNEVNAWIEYIGATEKYQVAEIPIRYEQNSGSDKVTYPYIIYTPSIKSYFIPSCEFTDDNVSMNYTYIKHYLTMYEKDVSALKEYLSPYFDIKKDAIDCYFGGNNSDFYTEKTSYSNDRIEYIRPLWNGIHEFSHYLTWNKDLPLWLLEGLAEYCSQYLESDDIFRMKKEYYKNMIIRGAISLDLYNKNVANANDKIKESYLIYGNEYEAYLLNKKDKTVGDTISWYATSRKDEEGADLSYQEIASFVNYLIKTYGEYKFFDTYKEYTKTKLHSIYGKSFSELKKEWLVELNSSIMLEYVLTSDGYKIAYLDTSKKYLPSKCSFVDILDEKTYEYVDCGLARNKDDEADPDANDFEGMDLNGKIALIQRGTPGKHFFYKQVNNAAKAGAVGVIVYNNKPGYFSMLLEGVVGNIPAIAILAEDGEFLKNAKEKRVTISKDFIGIIDNNH